MVKIFDIFIVGGNNNSQKINLHFDSLIHTSNLNKNFLSRVKGHLALESLTHTYIAFYIFQSAQILTELHNTPCIRQNSIINPIL